MEGGNNSSSNNNPDELAVGCLLSIRTTLGDEFEGQVVTFDRPSNILVLQEPSKPSPRRNLRLLKANYIKDFTFLGHAQDPLDPNTCFLDLTALQQREDVAVRYSFPSFNSPIFFFSLLYFFFVCLNNCYIWWNSCVASNDFWVVDKRRLMLRGLGLVLPARHRASLMLCPKRKCWLNHISVDQDSCFYLV